MKNITSLLLLLLITSGAAVGQTADLILTNGKIWTAESAEKIVTSVAIKGDKIIAAGDERSTANHRGPSTRVINLAGRFAMPGINDSHVHFLGASLTTTQVDLTAVRTLEEAQVAIRRFADANPNAPWITGFGWQYAIFPNARLPHRSDIDSVVKERPVVLSAYDGHTSWANSKALEIAGVTKTTEFTGFGEIVRDPNGEPTGVFK